MNHAPAPSPLARAVCQGLAGAPARGFSLFEIMLAMGGLALISGAGFLVYQGVANNADVRTEQANVQTIASNADKVYGALGSYQGLTTADAIQDKVPPSSMVAGAGLVSRWSQPVLLEPVDISAGTCTKPAAALRMTYQAVPARACAKFVQAGSEGMFDVAVGGASVFTHRPPDPNCIGAPPMPVRLDTAAAVAACKAGAPVAFTYYGGASGALAMVNPPVSLPPLNPPPATPPVAPPSAPPPVAPPPPPPAPGCGAAPSAPATGTTPPGQTCSFLWTSAPAPTCWVSQPLCTSIVAPPPVAPPTSTPPSGSPSAPPPPSTSAVCSAPPPTTETGNQTGACAAGTLTPSGSSTFPQTRTRTITYSCPDPFATAVPTTGAWSAWSPSASSACAPICSAPSPTSTAITRAASNENRDACPASYTGSTPQTRTRTENGTRTTSWSCPTPTGAATSSTSDAWSGTYSYGTWTASGPNTCAPPPPACSAPSPTSTAISRAASNENQTLSCKSGQLGSITQTRTRTENGTRTTSWSCPGPTSSISEVWGGGFTYGTWATTSNTCVDISFTCSCWTTPGMVPWPTNPLMGCVPEKPVGVNYTSAVYPCMID